MATDTPSLPSRLPSILLLALTTAAAIAAAMEEMSVWLLKPEGLKPPRPRLACNMAGSGLMSGGEPGAPPSDPCMFISHSDIRRCWARSCCCFMARSLLYMGPNLLRPPRILSCLTAVEKDSQHISQHFTSVQHQHINISPTTHQSSQHISPTSTHQHQSNHTSVITAHQSNINTSTSVQHQHITSTSHQSNINTSVIKSHQSHINTSPAHHIKHQHINISPTTHQSSQHISSTSTHH